ncbi:uncharacterized protein LTHEOB_6366 [Lasiodiplodia theobromae]|uniref:Uncharacterized protein n=1 Tax=Lasiodiplodia theobromae TaxID=45133 RepID=A0A5N5D158_9PEZI|nr:uncharacterized protein LTHEOB_6366 [Lasiodiplodia theobromae]KAB2571356.1 hypothetical protein DBV05_g9968 [Lasiodiplodia theobromae]KAF4544248.1 hypothetical protein LTHEOB_6366 [Lasiodiplodia theobromae]
MSSTIAINDGRDRVPLADSTAVRIQRSRLDWSTFMQAWTAGIIPSKDWMPSDMQIIFEGLYMALESKDGKTVRITSLLQWFEDKIDEYLLVAWRGDKIRAYRAGVKWVRPFAELCVSAVATSDMGVAPLRR